MILALIPPIWLISAPAKAALPQVSVPAFSCVVFPAEASERSLAAQFGANNVISGPVYGMDDGPQNGTILFPNDSAERVEILWRDKESKSRPRMIVLRGKLSRWQTVNGIVLGHELRTLERSNGRPFQLTGFRTESPGLIQSWSGGRLELAATPGCGVAVYLYPRPEDDDPRGPLGQVSHGTFSSAHPAMQGLNPRVVALVLRYSNP